VAELKVENLTVVVGSFSLSVPKLSVPSGSLTCLMGKSGSGKSTLLNAIAGFLPLSTGSIHFGETRLDTLPVERRRIGFVFQRSALFPHLSVRENVEFGLRLQRIPSAERKEKALAWLERLGIGDLAERFPRQISEGQAQRAAFARALITGFPVLLLDEPFSALDAESRERSRESLKNLVRVTKVAALMVTHHEEDASAVGDVVLTMEEGKIL